MHGSQLIAHSSQLIAHNSVYFKAERYYSILKYFKKRPGSIVFHIYVNILPAGGCKSCKICIIFMAYFT